MPINIPFGLLVFLIITSAVYVVQARNIVHSGVCMGLSFCGVAGLYLLLSAPFMAGAQVLIYVGAITVLILFALMMTQQRILREPKNAALTRTVAAVIALGLFGTLLTCINRPVWATRQELSPAPAGAEYLNSLAASLLGTYILPFEIASVLLLAALVGAIVLAKEEREA